MQRPLYAISQLNTMFGSIERIKLSPICAAAIAANTFGKLLGLGAPPGRWGGQVNLFRKERLFGTVCIECIE